MKVVLQGPLGPLTALMMADVPHVADLAEVRAVRLSVPYHALTLFAST